jgi:anti-anti-sigma regulatory factor
MMESKHSVIQGASVIDLHVDDLVNEKLCHMFLNALRDINIDNIVINLASVDVLSRADIEKLSAVDMGFKMMGKKVIFCGINPYMASILLTLETSVAFDTELDVTHALKKLSSKC